MQKGLRWKAAGYILSSLLTWVGLMGGTLITYISSDGSFLPQIPLIVLTIMSNVDNEPTTELFVSAAISCCVLPLGGFMDAMIYGWDTKLWEALLACLFCKRRRSRTRGSINGRGSILK